MLFHVAPNYITIVNNNLKSIISFPPNNRTTILHFVTDNFFLAALLFVVPFFCRSDILFSYGNKTLVSPNTRIESISNETTYLVWKNRHQRNKVLSKILLWRSIDPPPVQRLYQQILLLIHIINVHRCDGFVYFVSACVTCTYMYMGFFFSVPIYNLQCFAICIILLIRNREWFWVAAFDLRL